MSTECMFSCLSFVASSDTEVEDDAQGDATDRLFSGLDFTYKDSNAKDDAAQQPTRVMCRPELLPQPQLSLLVLSHLPGSEKYNRQIYAGASH